MKFEMEVNMNSVAFDDVYSNELIRILEDVKESLKEGSICRNIRDTNGNHVGMWAILNKDD